MKRLFLILLCFSLPSWSETKLSFNKDIRPILADRCYHCHGPDAKKGQKGGLRLDDEASAKADLYALKRAKKGLPALSSEEAKKKARHAIIPGDAKNSVAIQRILTDDEDDIMPPLDSNLKLTKEEKDKLIRWVKEGADFEKHWAFVTPKKSKVEKVFKGWASNELDNYVAKALSKAGLKPNKPAIKEKLIRRLSLTLRGLPPTLNEVDNFLNDKSPNAYEKLVDRFLADSSTGERLAIEWLDVARYGDSAGLFEDSFRSVWPWRDWVVRAFNNNKPFDEFIKEQVAGDLLPNATLQQQLATGFYRNNPTSNEGGIIDEEYLHLYAADRVKTTGIAFLGMSMECCQCHDHKYDPLSQKEFYEMSVFFRNIEEKGRQFSTAAPIIEVPSEKQKKEKERLSAEIAKTQKELAKLEKSPSAWQSSIENLSEVKISFSGRKNQIYLNEVSFPGLENGVEPKVTASKGAKGIKHLTDGKQETFFQLRTNKAFVSFKFEKPVSIKSLQLEIEKKHAKLLKGAKVEFKDSRGKVISFEQVNKPQERINIRARIPESLKLQSTLLSLQSSLKKLNDAIPKSMVMKDLKKPRATHILDRGDYEKKLEEVQANLPSAILPFSDRFSKNRLGLAEWLIDKNNPLTARVVINRYWQLVFGQGIVRTAEDFGLQGDLPSHPELLDWLAVEFIESGWNLKHMLKLMVTSSTFKQSSKLSTEKIAKDIDNTLISRGPGMRLQAELIRDNALAISGLLVKEMYGYPVKPYQPPGLWKEKTTKMPFVQDKGDKLYRKTLYTFWRRTSPHPSSMIFDATDRTTCVARRRPTTTPLQALVLLNDTQYVEAARVFAEKIILQGGSIEQKISKAWRTATSRFPSSQEVAVLKAEYQRRLSFYKQNTNKAKERLSVGEYPQNKKVDPAEQAAFMAVAQIILNLDETITLN